LGPEKKKCKFGSGRQKKENKRDGASQVTALTGRALVMKIAKERRGE